MLAIHAKLQVRDLGLMMKRLVSVQDWVDAQVPRLSYLLSKDRYRIIHVTANIVLLQHRPIERYSGRKVNVVVAQWSSWAGWSLKRSLPGSETLKA